MSLVSSNLLEVVVELVPLPSDKAVTEHCSLCDKMIMAAV